MRFGKKMDGLRLQILHGIFSTKKNVSISRPRILGGQFCPYLSDSRSHTKKDQGISFPAFVTQKNPEKSWPQKKTCFSQYLPVDLETPKAESESWNASSHWPGHEWKRWVFCLLGWGRPPTMSTGHGGSHQLAVGAGAKIPLVSSSNHLPRFGIVILSSNKELPFKKKKTNI